MGRKKGSLNKKNQPVQLNFDSNIKSLEEKTEVCMTLENDVNEKDEINDVPALIDTTLSNDEIEKENQLEVLNKELDDARIELERARLDIEAKKRELALMPAQPANQIKDAPASVNKDNSLKQKIEEMKARDSVMVTGKFHNLRVKGQSVKLPYIKYGDEPVKWHPFSHGQIYTIPKGFADQINGGSESDPCYYMPTFIKNDNPIIDPDHPETGIHGVDTTDKKYAFTPIWDS